MKQPSCPPVKPGSCDTTTDITAAPTTAYLTDSEDLEKAPPTSLPIQQQQTSAFPPSASDLAGASTPTPTSVSTKGAWTDLEKKDLADATDPVSPGQRASGFETDLDSPSEDSFLKASRLADSEVPDGGYGWVVVAACAVNFWWALGTTYSWGVIQEALVSEGLSSPATLSFIGGLMAAMISITGFVNARLIYRFGTRICALAGVFCMGGSGIISSFATKNLGALFFTSGALMGQGISLTFMVVSLLPSQYFSKRRGLANGMIFAGGGFGGAAISVGMDKLINHIGLPWAYRVLGLTTLATGIPASFFIKQRVKAKTPPALLDWRLFKSSSFTTVFIASAIGCFPLFVPPFFLPLYTRSLGFSSGVGAGLVAGFNLSSAFGRIMCGLFCDRFGALNTLLLSLVLTTISILAIWPVSKTLGPMCIFVIINGAANGGFFSTMPTVVSNVFGSARVNSAMGIMVMGWLGGYLFGAPIAGYILDASGGENGGLEAYRPAMYYAGSLAVTSAVLVVYVRWLKTGKLIARI
ncbi:hypothetical protein Cpir12675_006785 [Ceratocystis pirilliformis]|uniref:Major facilitator superfamily (MFS) profile domain-containing protein n=1 Tax=Ceratocystis pirilliformis TaxID=259994 RepID=A0ABR3YFI3_9PEZI